MTEKVEVVNMEMDEAETALALGVTVRDKKISVSSRDVARVFGKRHDNVLRDIQTLDCSKDFHALNFEEMIETVAIGKGASRETPFFQMTKNGFMFLVMGYTGKLAAQFKEAYISEFDRMEAELRGGAAGAALSAEELRAIAREAVQAEINRQLRNPSIDRHPLAHCVVDPSIDPRVQKRMRVLHLAARIPSRVKIGDWYRKVAQSEGVATSTIYRWVEEARETGKVAPCGTKPRWVHVSVDGLEFSVKTRAFGPEAVEWFANEWAAHPEIEIKSAFERFETLAKTNGWTIGGVSTFYRLSSQIIAAVSVNQRG
ncbi:MAG: Rha family transcriptional regulator [Synergistaceae bacterium]|jgi:Rha family phage regulatory protein|nr:Rha family transcriptional regulator [Synergistaceae bacterium]